VIVLGISGGFGHDAAAALVVDGEIVAAVEEERLVRRKHAYGQAPVHSARWCLAQGGIRLDDVDVLALSWQPTEQPDWPLLLHESLLSHPFFAGSARPAIEVVGHARAHAAASYYCSGFEDAAILTVDGQGDSISTTLGVGGGDIIDLQQEFGIGDSLGFFYLALTNHLGFELGEEGKVMGLASYASPSDFPLPFDLTNEGYRAIGTPRNGSDPYALYRSVVAHWRGWCERTLGPPVRVSYPLDPLQSRATVEVQLAPPQERAAATGQAILEQTLLHLVGLAVERSGSRRLVIGGGVGLNCSANGVIERSGLVDDLYVFPASGDAGTSVGAALSVSAASGQRPRRPVESAALGPAYSDAATADLVRDLGLTAERPSDIADHAAERIARGEVIGWFQGRCEIGPRALGNRSILADPGDAGNRNRVNAIKGRERWRPLAPSILGSAGHEIVDTHGRAPFMLTACPVRASAQDALPAVVHVDGTCRPQFVRPESNPRYAALLQRLEERRGLPVVLNTSFNVAGEPLVCTPYDAIRTFFASSLNALVIGDTVVLKQR